MKNKLKSALLKYPKIYSLVKKVYIFVVVLKRRIRNIISFPLLFVPIQNKKIVVSNYKGKGYGDNGKYIVEEIIKQELDYDIVWLLKRNLVGKVELPSQVRVVEYGTYKCLYELATAKIWIDNCRKDFSPAKKKDQFYIQTWHSPLRLKKIEKDAQDSLSSEYIRMGIKDSKECDLMISGCDFSWNIYRNSFWYDGEILKCGTPRCDLFFNNNKNIRKKVYNEFKLNTNTKLILFAPTFRTDTGIESYLLEFGEILKVLEIRFGGEWKLLVRLHPNVSDQSSLIEYSDSIINATNYHDMQELLSSVDILITDYSSSMFDMAIANKICFLHGKDVEHYLEKERDMYFDFGELPFDFSKTDDQLIDNILKFDEKIYRDKLDTFSKKVNLYETGTASIQLIEKIKAVIEG